MRHGVLSDKDGIDVVYGIKDGKTEIQSYLFKKDKWTEDKVKQWIEDHGAKIMAYKLGDVPLFKLSNVQIFRSGTWNGSTYSKDDLKEMEDNFNRLKKDNPDFTLPLKLGHQQDDMEPAVGWMDNIKAIGETLYADLVDLPETIYNFIKLKGYKNRSVEIIEKYNSQGKVVGKMLRGMSLLGASLPAVNMRDVDHGVQGLSKLGKALYGRHFDAECEFSVISMSEEETIMEEIKEEMPKEEASTEQTVVEMACKEPEKMEEMPKEEIVEEMSQNPFTEVTQPIVGIGNNNPINTDNEVELLKKAIIELQAQVSSLLSNEADMKQKLCAYKEKELENERQEKMEFVEQLLKENKILPSIKEKVFAILDSLDNTTTVVKFSDGEEKEEPKVKLFKDILSSLPSIGLTDRVSIVEETLGYNEAVNKFSMDQFGKKYSELNKEETREVLNKMASNEKYKKYIG